MLSVDVPDEMLVEVMLRRDITVAGLDFGHHSPVFESVTR